MAAPGIRFGSHVFDPDTGSLRSGDADCRLQAQPAQLLGLFLHQAGETVTREQIRQTLWPDTVVSYDQNINFAVRQIRVALGADAGLLQTVPRRGYRFIGQITQGDVPQRRNWGRSMAAAAAIVLAMASGFGAGILVREAPAGQFVYDHLVHPDRCPYLRPFFPIHRNS